MTRALWLWLMAWVLAAGISLAAEKPAGAPAAAPVATEKPVIREQSVYIPYSKLREVFEKEGRGVFLPYEKFQALWQAARDKTAPPPEAAPPLDALITEADCRATVSKDVVTVAATVKIEVLKEGWTEVPLRLGDSAIVKATIEDQPARIVAADGGGYKLLVEKKGKAPQSLVLALTFAKAFAKAPGQNSVSFECPAAPVSRWEVRIPEGGVKVNIQPLLAATEAPPDAAKPDETVILAFVGAAPIVRIDWTPKAEGARGLEALATVQVHQQMTIEEGVTRTRAQLAYEISRAEVSRLEVEVPAQEKVVNVFDPNVREWSVGPAADGMQRLTVNLFEPARQSQNLVVELERFVAGGAAEVAAPVVKALGVSRQQGVVVVQVASDLRAEASEQSGLMQLDAADLPPALARGKWDFCYRYAALPFRLALRIEKVQPRILADTLVEAHLSAEELVTDWLVVYTIERAGVFRLELDVPEGCDVRAVRGASVAGATAVQVDSHHLEGDKKTHLVVNLARKALGKVALDVQLHRSLKEPDLAAPTGKAARLVVGVPRVAPAGIERETGRLVVYAPESLSVNPTDGAGLRTITHQEAVKDLRTTARPAERAVLAYAFDQDGASLAISAERRRPHVTVAQLLVARIDSGVVKYESTLFYEVLYSGVKALRIDVPQDLAPILRVEPLTIRHEPVAASEKPADLADGYVAWRLSGDAEFLGKVQVRLAWEHKIEKLDVGKSVDLAIPRIVPRQTDRAWGQIVLVKAETIDVQPSESAGKVKGLRPIDPQHDLMPGAAVAAAARAFEFHDDWALTVVATMYKLEEVKHTSIERGLVRAVVTRSRLASVQALYRMRSARQRLLVRLPEGVQFDTEPLKINGRAVSLERGGSADQAGTFFVPLVGQSPEASFLLDLRYTVPADRLRLDCPTFPEEPAVQKVYFSVWLPAEWDYLGSCGPWTDEMVWRIGDDLRWRPRPIFPEFVQGASQEQVFTLIGWVCEGVGGIDPADVHKGLQTDGAAYLFSTLRPAAPPEGSLRLAALDADWLAAIIIAAVLTGGVVLMFIRAAVRLIAVGALVAAIVLAAVFAPALARQTAGAPMAAAAAVVLVLWLVWYLVWTRPHDPRVIARRQARQAARQQAAGAASAQAPTPAPPATGQPPTAPPQPPSEGGDAHA